MRLGGQYYFWRETEKGERQISWRTWVLVWVLPGLMLAAAVLMLGLESYRHLATVPTQGTVVRVYAWEGETVFDRGVTNYGPVFRYVWADGTETEASVGMSHPDWDFEIGSVRQIRYFPSVRTNVVLPGLEDFMAGLIVGALGLVCLVPALFATLRLRRWKSGGRS